MENETEKTRKQTDRSVSEPAASSPSPSPLPPSPVLLLLPPSAVLPLLLLLLLLLLLRPPASRPVRTTTTTTTTTSFPRRSEERMTASFSDSDGGDGETGKRSESVVRSPLRSDSDSPSLFGRVKRMHEDRRAETSGPVPPPPTPWTRYKKGPNHKNPKRPVPTASVTPNPRTVPTLSWPVPVLPDSPRRDAAPERDPLSNFSLYLRQMASVRGRGSQPVPGPGPVSRPVPDSVPESVSFPVPSPVFPSPPPSPSPSSSSSSPARFSFLAAACSEAFRSHVAARRGGRGRGGRGGGGGGHGARRPENSRQR